MRRILGACALTAVLAPDLALAASSSLWSRPPVLCSFVFGGHRTPLERALDRPDVVFHTTETLIDFDTREITLTFGVADTSLTYPFDGRDTEFFEVLTFGAVDAPETVTSGDLAGFILRFGGTYHMDLVIGHAAGSVQAHYAGVCTPKESG